MIYSTSKYLFINNVQSKINTCGLYNILSIQGSDKNIENCKQYKDINNKDIEILYIICCENLYLDENVLFYNKKLNKISISSCTIKSLNFIKKLNLEYINLSVNRLSLLDKDLFKHNIKLEYIDLSSNNLLRLDKDLLKSNINLIKIDISRNNLSSVDKDLFKHNINLESLNLSFNKLMLLDKYLFNSNINLAHINLSYNELLSIDNVLFSNNVKLEKLYINNNKLETIGLSIFNNNRNMKELDISNNNIKLLPYNLISLKYLSAKNTNLITLSNVNFRDLEICEILNTNISRLQLKNGTRLTNLKEIVLNKKDKHKIKYIDPLLKDYVNFISY
jgi:Leucine-rich repeat (LRR) protein